MNSTSRNIAYPFLSLSIVFACSNCDSKDTGVSEPDNWVKVECPDFAFWIPENFEDKSKIGFDSYTRKFVSTQIDLSLDYGSVAGDVSGSEFDSFKKTHTTVNGRKSTLIDGYSPHPGHKFDYMAAAHFPPKERDVSALLIWANCSDKSAVELAKTIFKTVRFHE
ncbi:MAG: hypothetical protein AAF591_01505 [Verrucomicrobiota bacterium]